MIKLLDWIGAIAIGLVGWAWKHFDKRFGDLRDYVDEQDTEIKNEVNRQRDVSAKIFDKLEEHGKRSEERHLQLLTALHEGLAKKADK